MRYYPHDKQRDERFPKHETEYASDNERNDDGRRDIYYGDIKDAVRVRAFSRTAEEVFIAA